MKKDNSMNSSENHNSKECHEVKKTQESKVNMESNEHMDTQKFDEIVESEEPHEVKKSQELKESQDSIENWNENSSNDNDKISDKKSLSRDESQESNSKQKYPKEQSLWYIKLLDPFKWIYEKLGVNFFQMRLIVEMKMRIDSRRNMAGMETITGADSKNKKEKNQFFQSLWVYPLISLLIVMLFVVENLVFQMTTFFGFLFVMMITLLISHFSSMILDQTDQELIGTKPISSKTLSAAKATYIGFYLLSLALSLSVVVIVVTFISYGVATGLLLIGQTILATFWCLFLTNILYAALLHRFDGQKLQSLIVYFQIGVSLVFFGGFHLLSSIFEVVNPETMSISIGTSWWTILLFPLWFVAPMELLYTGWSWNYVIYFGLLIVGTIVLSILYLRSNEQIEQNLQKMNDDSSNHEDKYIFGSFIRKLVCFDSKEGTYFDFSWRITKKEREFKTRLYPTLISSLIVPVTMVMTDVRDVGLLEASEGVFFRFSPYFVLMTIPMLTAMLNYSKDFNAKWIFSVTPETNRGMMLRGVYKALLFKLLFPLYGFLAVFILVLSGINQIPTLLAGFFLVAIVFYLDIKRNVKKIPFTQEYDASEANRGCLATGIFTLATFFLVGGMYFLDIIIPYSMMGIAFILGAIVFWLFRKKF